ncbi:MAG: Fibronectin type domain protein [bacterium]|nr:Fibronectin type domain protein [bacterium]
MKSIIRSLALGAIALVAVGCKNNNASNDGGGGGGGGGGGSASGMTMTMTGLPTAVMASTGQTVHVAVANHDGTPATGYTGTVNFTSTDAAAVLPAAYTFTGTDAGAHDFMVTLNTNGMQTLTVTDASDSGLTASEDTTVSGPAFYYVPPTAGKIQLLPNLTQSTPTLAVLELTAMVDLTGYFVGFDVAIDGTKLAPDANLMTAGTVLKPGTAPAAIAAALPTAGPLAGALVTGISQKASGGGAVATDATIKAGDVFYTIKLPLKSGATGGVIMDGTVAKNKIRAGLRNKAGTEVVGIADVGIGKLVYTP